jgi:hypothetical protein
MYEFSKDIKNFIDDGTTPGGWGEGRHDQTLYSILARKLNYNILTHDNDNVKCSLTVDSSDIKFHLTHAHNRVSKETDIFRSRWTMQYESYKDYCFFIKRKYIVSCITAIGKLDKYEKFIEQYFENIQTQNNFSRIQFVIVYSQWSNLFNHYKHLKNIKFVKEDIPTGVYNGWNLGIVHSDSEYVTTWNIDDLRYPINNKVKYDLLSKNKNIDLAYNYYVGCALENLQEGIDLSTIPIQKYPDEYHNHVMIACMAGPDPMWRKSFHLFGGYFDQKYSIVGDWEMWIRMAKFNLKFKLIPNVLCIYVEHKDTVSNSDNSKLEKQKMDLLKKYSI